MKRNSLLAIVAAFSSGAIHAGSLCDVSPCDVTLDFADGGEISAPNGAILQFELGGELLLGDGGSIVLGDSGSLEGLSEAVLTAGGVLPEFSRLTFGENGTIEFGPGGWLSFTGNIVYPELSVVDVVGAVSVDVAAVEEQTIVTVATISVVGNVLLRAQEGISIGAGGDNVEGLAIFDDDTSHTVKLEGSNVVVMDANVAMGNGIIDVPVGGEDCDDLSGNGSSATLGAGLSAGDVSAGENSSVVGVDIPCVSNVLSGGEIELVDGGLLVLEIGDEEPEVTESNGGEDVDSTDMNNNVDEDAGGSVNPFVESGGGGAFSCLGIWALVLLRCLNGRLKRSSFDQAC